VARLVGTNVRIECDEQRLRPVASEVERLLADNRLAAETVGWKPTVSLEEGLQQTIEWFRGNAKGYRADVYNV
jgi:nucleoside-diphosphate-sugar epimerase